MSEKVTADEMQDANETIIEAEGAIRTIGKLLMESANDCGCGNVDQNELVRLASWVTLSIADKLESAIVTTDNAHSNGCAGTLEGDAAE